MVYSRETSDCAEDWMTRDPVTIEPTESVLTAAKIMRDQKIGYILVKTESKKTLLGLQEGKVVGIITDTDIVRKIVAKQLPMYRTKISDVMTSPLLFAKHSHSLFHITQILAEHKVKRLPIMEKGKLVGILSITNLLYALIKLGMMQGLDTIIGTISHKKFDQSTVDQAAKVDYWMSKPVLTIKKNTDILTAAQLMNQYKLGSLVIVGDNKMLIGIITDTDLVHKIVASQKDIKLVTVGDIMTRELITTTPDATLLEVQKLIIEKKLRRVPVIKEYQPVGMLSITDVLSAFSQLKIVSKISDIVENIDE